jgi:hypothetical protein
MIIQVNHVGRIFLPDDNKRYFVNHFSVSNEPVIANFQQGTF